jgi:hypothetical protein
LTYSHKNFGFRKRRPGPPTGDVFQMRGGHISCLEWVRKIE